MEVKPGMTTSSRRWTSISKVVTVSFLNFVLLYPAYGAFTLDTTFNGTGKVTLSFPDSTANYSSQALRVYVQPSGRILVGGTFTNGTSDGQLTGIAWAGFTPGGLPDGGYGSGGRFTAWRSDGSTSFIDAFMYPNGAIMQTAQFFRLPVGSRTVDTFRLDPNGGFDSVFASNVSIGPCCFGFFNARPFQIAARADGKILVLITDEGQLQLYRLNPDGSRDTTFGNNGILGVGFNKFSSGGFVEMIALGDGKILFVGLVAPVGPNGASELFFARMTETGNWDKTFGRVGMLRVPIAPGMTGGVSKAILQPDGKILLSGSVVGTDTDVWLARFRPNGRADTTFGNNGIVIQDFAPGDTDIANSVVVGADGKIRIAGQIGPAATSSFLVARFSSTGLLEDHTTVAFTPDQYAGAADLAMQADGKVVVAGRTKNPVMGNTGSMFAIARLTE